MHEVYNNITEIPLLYGCDGEVEMDVQRVESILWSATLFTMIVVATFGNLLVIMSILRNRELRVMRNALLCSLATIDLLSPLLRLLPIAIATASKRWIFGCNFCQVSSRFGTLLASAVIFHLCAITLERYFSICFPFRSRNWITRKRLTFSIITIWFFSILVASLPYLIPSIKIFFNRNLPSCDVSVGNDPDLSIQLGCIYFGGPFILMVIAYYRIYRKTVESNVNMSRFASGSERKTEQHEE